MRIIDADGHVAENSSLAIEAIQRWPEHVKPGRHGRLGLMIEGRNYPEDRGPGAGCPPEHGISDAPDINCRSAEGVLGDADRDHIDTMVLYPSLGLCAPSLRDPSSPPGSPGCTTVGSPTTAPSRADGCAASRSRRSNTANWRSTS